MCGIVGYFGSKDARKILMDGLNTLEYRGYDSAGIALFDSDIDKVKIFKRQGRVSDLTKIVDYSFNTNMGIGHSRWATHGKPSDINSHPHNSMNNRFIIVHNGVIENANVIKNKILKDFTFKTETDTEVIANLIQYYSNELETHEAIRKTLINLEGSYALLIMDTEDLNKIYIAKDKTPLLVGKTDHGIILGSDVMVFIKDCKEYISLLDKTFGVISNDGYEFFDFLGNSKDYLKKEINSLLEDASLGDYEHYMLKEIEEQPLVIRRLIGEFFTNDDKPNIDLKIINDINASDKVYFVACGSSMHASMLGRYYFETLAYKPTEVCIASELGYNDIFLEKNPYFIVLSQSGETLDCIEVMKKVKNKGYKCLAITNTLDSTINNLADNVLYLNAGKEIAVAATKTYLAQGVLLSILASSLTSKKTNLRSNLNNLWLVIEKILEDKQTIKEIACKLKDTNSVFFIGRNIDYFLGLEAALKLKELSYIHAECYPSGELKHGTIALIEENVPVITLITQMQTDAIVRSNLEETITRGAKPIVFSTKECSRIDDDYIVADVAHNLRPLAMLVVCQLIAYYTALQLGKDVDKPRNLAKSVTVE